MNACFSGMSLRRLLDFIAIQNAILVLIEPVKSLFVAIGVLGEADFAVMIGVEFRQPRDSFVLSLALALGFAAACAGLALRRSFGSLRRLLAGLAGAQQLLQLAMGRDDLGEFFLAQGAVSIAVAELHAPLESLGVLAGNFVLGQLAVGIAIEMFENFFRVQVAAAGQRTANPLDSFLKLLLADGTVAVGIGIGRQAIEAFAPLIGNFVRRDLAVLIAIEMAKEVVHRFRAGQAAKSLRQLFVGARLARRDSRPATNSSRLSRPFLSPSACLSKRSYRARRSSGISSRDSWPSWLPSNCSNKAVLDDDPSAPSAVVFDGSAPTAVTTPKQVTSSPRLRDTFVALLSSLFEPTITSLVGLAAGRPQAPPAGLRQQGWQARVHPIKEPRWQSGVPPIRRPAVCGRRAGLRRWLGLFLLSYLPISLYGDVARRVPNSYNPAARRTPTAGREVLRLGMLHGGNVVMREGDRFSPSGRPFHQFITAVTAAGEGGRPATDAGEN